MGIVKVERAGFAGVFEGVDIIVKLTRAEAENLHWDLGWSPLYDLSSPLREALDALLSLGEDEIHE